MKAKDRLRVAVIVPAYNAAVFLLRSAAHFAALAESARVIVIDAGSTDQTEEVARTFADQVERHGARQGPSEARNSGAALAEEEILLFIDADCIPHADVVDRVRRAFEADPELVSVTGSYDDDPPEPNFASQYMNLRHHFTHQHARREPGSFWAGCGAVRRSVFLEVGGFDAKRYPRPAIEDIELATRLQPRGRTLLDPELQVTHLKRWTLRSVVETDILHRCIPWARLVRETGELPDDLNTSRRQRVLVAVALAAIAALGAIPFAVASGAWGWAGMGGTVIAASVALNAPLLRFFAARRGLAFASRAWLFHQFHLCYSGVVFGAMLGWHRLSVPFGKAE